MTKLQGVEETLYIPLTARIEISKRFPDFFYDEKALSLESYIDNENIKKNSSEYFYMASVCRYRIVDEIVNNFISKHNNCNVINLGIGLETMYYRLNNKNAVFYEIDLPDVIDVREKIFERNKNEVLIKGNMFDLSWSNNIDLSLPTIIVSTGVFQYFDIQRITNLINSIKNKFNECELVFDAMNSNAIKYANKYVEKTGNKNAKMNFYVDDPKGFGSELNIKLIAHRPFFTDARKLLKRRLKLYTRIAMKVVDEGSRKGYILHYRLSD